MPTDTANDEIDFRRVFSILWDGKWVIGGCTIVGAVMAVAYALLATPIYRAEALVQIRHESRPGGAFGTLTAQLGGSLDLAALTGANSGDRALALATLKSRVLIQSFIREMNLLPEIFADLWDPVSNRWKNADPKKNPTLGDGYKAFSEMILKVTEDKKSGLVTIAIEWKDPKRSATWLTELIARTNAYLRDKAIRESESNLEYLRQQLKQTGLVELHHSAYALMESELKKLMLAKGGDEYAIKTIDPAQTPEQRVRPKRRQIALVGLLLGAAVGLFATFVRSIVAGPRSTA